MGDATPHGSPERPAGGEQAAAAERLKGIDKLQQELRDVEFAPLQPGMLGGGPAAALLMDALAKAQKQLEREAAAAADELDLAWEVNYVRATGDASRLEAMLKRRPDDGSATPA